MRKRKLFVATLFIAIALFCVACSKETADADKGITSTPEPGVESATESEINVAPTTESEPTGEPTTELKPTVAPTTEPDSTAAPTTELKPTVAPTTKPDSTVAPTTKPEPTTKPTTEPTAEPAPTTKPTPSLKSDADDTTADGETIEIEEDDSDLFIPSTDEFTGNGAFADMTDLADRWDNMEDDSGYIIEEDGTTYAWDSEGDVDYDNPYTITFASDFELLLYNQDGVVILTFRIEDEDTIIAEGGHYYEREDSDGCYISGICDAVGNWICEEEDSYFSVEEDGIVTIWNSGVEFESDSELWLYVDTDDTLAIYDQDDKKINFFEVIDYNSLLSEDGTNWVRVEEFYDDEDWD